MGNIEFIYIAEWGAYNFYWDQLTEKLHLIQFQILVPAGGIDITNQKSWC